jgi:HEAT repeat protein
LASELPARTRRAAVYGFVWVHRPTAADVKRLLRIHQDPTESPDIRGQAAEALGPSVVARGKAGRVRQNDARSLARDALLRGLDDPEPEVRFWSIFALASPENEWLLPKLESMVGDRALVPGWWTVGREAGWAIRWMRREGDVDPRSL